MPLVTPVTTEHFISTVSSYANLRKFGYMFEYVLVEHCCRITNWFVKNLIEQVLYRVQDGLFIQPNFVMV